MMPLGLMDLLLGTGPESTLFHTEKVNVIDTLSMSLSLSSQCLLSFQFYKFLSFILYFRDWCMIDN